MPTNTNTDADCPAEPGRSSEEPTAVHLTVTGTVQGVGFRPFVARTAAEYGLSGTVRNTDAGVRIRFEGDEQAVEAAVDAVRTDPPRLARIEEVTVESVPLRGADEFVIADSDSDGDRAALVPPDTAVCESCLADIRDEDSRFTEYWATGCVDCGPRFAVTDGLPYDRRRTAFAPFPPCPDCRADLTDRTDRRYHAQTIACPACGPSLAIETDPGDRVEGTTALSRAADLLRDGQVVGIKGTGGCHLACLATDADAVGRLRRVLDRPAKPLATMAPSLSTVREFATVTERERAALTGRRRPIVLLDHDGPLWADHVAPGLHTVGVMLPYSGLHHLLFDRLPQVPLVVTSANRPGQPMATTAEELRSLDASDAALVHDRGIENRCDDSVLRVVGGDRRLVRRSRGFVPRALPRRVRPPDGSEVVALGARTDVTVALTRGDRVVPSQHVGTVDDPATAAFHRSATERLRDLLDVSPDVVAHDAHPDFETTAIAADRSERAVPVQHHHAHAASLLGEGDRSRSIVVAADGTGWGPEGVVRGGEVLDARLANSDRVGGLDRFPLPGGDRAVEEPARVAAGLLAGRDRERARSLLLSSGTVDTPQAARAVLRQATQGTNSPPTTSVGRFLDGVAALLGCCTRRRYQGEPAMRLESLARRGEPVAIASETFERDGQRLLDTYGLMARLAALTDARPDTDVAATAQRLVADGLAEIALHAARDRGVDAVGFTGGVAYNEAIDRRFRQRVRAAGFTYLSHDRVPPGDAGIAYGQALAASARLTR
ncbi:carbamoyltransferase HypF [Haloarcula halophila]|uniref:carbamoyltransferase HypF n=1 Tax=Haloarcula TaxID=2237 RepID=UPI0023E44A20|nr:carbamoyltransferase HypF [Halomicroarcula sp. DFY41]